MPSESDSGICGLFPGLPFESLALDTVDAAGKARKRRELQNDGSVKAFTTLINHEGSMRYWDTLAVFSAAAQVYDGLVGFALLLKPLLGCSCSCS